MADEKKDEGGGDGGGGGGFFWDALFWVLLALTVYSVFQIFMSRAGINFSGLPSFSTVFTVIFDKVQVFSIFISLAIFMAMIYLNFKIKDSVHRGGYGGGSDKKGGHGRHQPAPAAPVKIQNHTNERWQSVIKHISSENENDWRHAIMEADIILNDMLDRMGYIGDSVAEKLKRVEPADFKTLDIAWEAHKIRNEIAHQGSGYKLTRREAERAVLLFKKVFEEFYYV